MTSILDPKKIKSFLYREQQSMPKLNGASLDLISTTLTILLKSIIDDAIQRKKCGDFNSDNIGTLPRESLTQTNEILITSTDLLRVISINPSYDFLRRVFEAFKYKDGNANAVLKPFRSKSEKKRKKCDIQRSLNNSMLGSIQPVTRKRKRTNLTQDEEYSNTLADLSFDNTVKDETISSIQSSDPLKFAKNVIEGISKISETAQAMFTERVIVADDDEYD